MSKWTCSTWTWTTCHRLSTQLTHNTQQSPTSAQLRKSINLILFAKDTPSNTTMDCFLLEMKVCHPPTITTKRKPFWISSSFSKMLNPKRLLETQIASPWVPPRTFIRLNKMTYQITTLKFKIKALESVKPSQTWATPKIVHPRAAWHKANQYLTWRKYLKWRLRKSFKDLLNRKISLRCLMASTFK